MSAAGRPDGAPKGGPYGVRDGAVRRCLLAVSVLHDLDLTWDDSRRRDDVRTPGDGLPDVHVEGPVPVEVPGWRLAELLANDVPDDAVTVARVARFLRLRVALAQLPPASVVASLRVVGLPVGHALHPGPGWVRRQVPGGALALGLGLLPDGAVVTDDQQADEQVPVLVAPPPLPLPGGVLEDAGFDPDRLWPSAVQRLEELGALAAARSRRRPRDPLRPLAEADVVTLLGCRALRAQLADGTGTGLAALVVPMRNRGWVSSSAIDPAFGPAAAAATSEEARGFPRPLLVTAEEVVQVPEGGHPLRYLGDQASGSPLS